MSNIDEKADEPIWSVFGIYEPYEGIFEFDNIAEYIENWLKPNLLTGLKTVFAGSLREWEHLQRANGAPGRGDFALATTVVAAMDHIGALMVPSRYHNLDSKTNIARVAKELDTTCDIFALFAYLGRNCLLHGTWPQTASWYRPDHKKETQEDWGVGLSFTSNKDMNRNNTIHLVRHQNEVDGRVQQREVIKVVLNIRQIHCEFDAFVRSDQFRKRVKDDGFDRVKSLAETAGYPKLKEFKKLEAGKSRLKLEEIDPEITPENFLEQQRLIREQAKRVDIWNAKPGEKKMRRPEQMRKTP